MTRLAELMRDATDHAPAEGWDTDRLVRMGRGRLARRRAAGVGVVAGVVAVATATTVAWQHASGSDRPPTSPSLGPSISVTRAADGSAGRDWATLGSVTNRQLMVGADHLGIEGTLPDGRLVVGEFTSFSTGEQSTGRLGLFDPSQGRVAWFPDRETGPYLGRDGSRLVFGVPADVKGVSDPGYQVYHLDAGRWSVLPRNAEVDAEYPGALQSQVVSGGSLYVALDTAPTRTLWQVPVDGSGAWRQIGTVGVFDVAGGVLAYSDAVEAPAGTIVLRTLATGHEERIDASTGSGCHLQDLRLTTDYLLLHLDCPDPTLGDLQQLVVLDHSGAPIGHLTAGEIEVDTVTDGLVTFSVPTAAGDQPLPRLVGTFAFHPSTGQVVRLSRHAVAAGPFAANEESLLLSHQSSFLGGRPDDVAFEVVAPQ